MGLGRWLLLSGVLSCLPFGACSSSEDGGAGGTGAGAGTDAGASYSKSACFACIAPGCGVQIDACNADPSCAEYLACVGACPVAATGSVDASCASGCALDHPGGETVRAAFETCHGAQASGCPACGGVSDAGGPDSGKHPVLEQTCGPFTHSDPCWECMNQECCESLAALEEPGPNKDLDTCLTACTTIACEIDCVTQYPEGMPAFGGWWACTATNCVAVDKCTSHSDCTKCTYTECANEYAACQVNADCYRTMTCIASCLPGATACPEDCIAQYPGGAELVGTLRACVSQLCQELC
jgi:hypothetical protein